MIIQIDCNEKKHEIERLIQYFDANGIKHYTKTCWVGDYWTPSNPMVWVDRKKNLTEVCGNLAQDHERFRRECLRAQEFGYKLIFLIEHGEGITSIEDVDQWENPRLKKSPKATTGATLAKTMRTMSERYGVEWRFCEKADTGRVIVEILGGKSE